MALNTLRVRAKGTALVTDYEALDAGVKRFVGFKATGAGFEATDAIAELPMRAEYVQAVKDGDLEPADADTAKACGLKTFASVKPLAAPNAADKEASK